MVVYVGSVVSLLFLISRSLIVNSASNSKKNHIREVSAAKTDLEQLPPFDLDSSRQLPLRLCEGKCTGDSECQRGLICIPHNENEPRPDRCQQKVVASHYCYNNSLEAAPTRVLNSNETGTNVTSSFMVQFSLLHNNRSLTAASFLFRLEPEDVTGTVLNATIETLCSDTDFIIADSVSSAADSDYCRNIRTFVGEFEFASIVSTRAGFKIVDMRNDELDWTVWSIKFLVLQVGQVYLQGAHDSLASDSNSSKALHNEALRLTGSVAQDAISHNIQNGRFDSLLGSEMRASAVGQEENTFLPGSQKASESKAGSKEEALQDIDPAPMHSLRITGIVMFVVNAISIAILGYLAAEKKRERLEAEAREQDIPGGLESERQIDIMLEAGKGNAYHDSPSQDITEEASVSS